MGIEIDITCDTSGADAMLDRLSPDSGRLREALLVAGRTVEGSAKGHAPVDTGHLRNSISTAAEGDNSVVVGTNVEYAIYQEFGTYKMRAHPFMTPALTENAGNIVTIVKAALGL